MSNIDHYELGLAWSTPNMKAFLKQLEYINETLRIQQVQIDKLIAKLDRITAANANTIDGDDSNG